MSTSRKARHDRRLVTVLAAIVVLLAAIAVGLVSVTTISEPDGGNTAVANANTPPSGNPGTAGLRPQPKPTSNFQSDPLPSGVPAAPRVTPGDRVPSEAIAAPKPALTAAAPKPPSAAAAPSLQPPPVVDPQTPVEPARRTPQAVELVQVPSAPTIEGLSGKISIEGTAALQPLMERLASAFVIANTGVKIEVKGSGTGAGFKKFGRGETDISIANRPMKSIEADACEASGIRYMGLPFAYQAVAVVIHLDNTWAGEMTAQELKVLWQPEAQGKVTHWNQIRPDWPSERIDLVGPELFDTGSFDLFTAEIVGTARLIRTDVQKHNDAGSMAQYVAGARHALGFLSLSNCQVHADKLRSVAVRATDDEKFRSPSEESVTDWHYRPLAYLFHAYVSDKPMKRPEVVAFLSYLLSSAEVASRSHGFVPLKEETLKLVKSRFVKREWRDDALGAVPDAATQPQVKRASATSELSQANATASK